MRFLPAVLLTFICGFTVHGARADDGTSALLGNIRQLTFEGRRAGEGYFSADGRRLIFQSERQPGNPFYQMYLLDLETGDIDRLSPGHGKTTCGWLHPDGRRALFASTQDDPDARAKQKKEIEIRASGKSRRYAWDYDETYDIQEVDLATKAYRNLTRARGYDAEGAYSPDGRQIVFASNRAAYSRALSGEEQAIFARDKSYFMDIYVMNADGSNVRRLTAAPGYDGGPFFSADGGKIVWRRFSEDGSKAEIFTMNADGTGERRITRLGALSWAPFFHPSGDYMIFATNLQGFANFELYLVDADGKKNPVRVTDRQGFDGLPAFSPDGKRLAWASKPERDKGTQIFMADWNDAEARRLLGLTSRDGTAAKPMPGGPDMSRTAAAIRAEDLALHVTALASEAMQGRLTGTPGEAKAADYVARAFASLGLSPAGDAGTWFQDFDFTAGVSLGDANRLTIAGVGDLELNRQWRPLAFSKTGDSGTHGVAFAGFGIVAPADAEHEAYDSYGGLDVAGKWVLVFRGVPQEVDADRRLQLTRFADLRYKASVARSRGAKGLIVAPAPGITYKDPLVRLTFEAAFGAAGLPSVSIDGAVARDLLQPSVQDLDRLYEKLNKGEKVEGRLVAKAGIRARIDLNFERRRGRNVLARLKTGAAPEAPVLVLGAHLDHLGRGETSGSLARPGERDLIHYGADDNASGVAGLIEIAQFLAARHKDGRLKPKRDILFAAWSGEELGLLGSAHFVKTLANGKGVKTLNGTVSAYLNMDMVGRLRKQLSLFGLGSSPVWKREIERANVPVGLALATNADTYLPTDATSFYLKGVPILHAFTGTHTDYSTPRDTADKINFEGLEKVARLMGLIARSQARTATAPAFVKRDRPRRTAGRRRGGVYLGTIPDYASKSKIGVPLSGVMKGGPAEKAGLEGGDVIVGLAGARIGNIYDFVRVMNGMKVGLPAEVVVARKGRRVKLTIKPAPRE